MVTGVLSAGLRLTGHEAAAPAAPALVAAVWGLRAGLFTARPARYRERWWRDATTPAGLTVRRP